MIGNIVGSYKITNKIGEGGMGAVFRGIDIMLEREVAIKMLRPELSRQPNIVERFRSEAVTLAKLNHPNIATLYSFLRQGDDFFMVMEFVRGETLDMVIRKSGAMACDRALALFCQALEGIDHAHKMAIIHRDIKPANMMLTEHGTLKVMDFGIARVLGTARMTKQGNIVGTIEYMSPEQVRGQETDARSDIYSLGILLYEMLTGRVPFASNSEYDLMKMQIEVAPQPPRVFSPHIPQAVEQAIMRALAKRTEARPRTAGEFRAALLSSAPAVSNLLAPKLDSAATSPRVVKPITAPAFGEEMKETRLAGESGSAAVAIDSQVKVTRLGQAGSVQPIHVQSRPDYVQDQPQMTQPARKSALSKFNWKHYASAAVVLLVLIVGLVWVIGIGKHEAARQPAVGSPESAPSALTPDPPTPTTEPNPTPPPGETRTPSSSSPNSTGQPESGIVLIPESPTANKRPTGGRSKSEAAAREKARKRKASLDALDKQ